MQTPTISESYRSLQRQLHDARPDYGSASLRSAPAVAGLMRDAQVRSVCDYGAGKMRLLEGLRQQGVQGFEYFPYDPAFPEYGEARHADLVCCIDVMEHIEPEYIDAVIDDLARLMGRLGFISVATVPAAKVLPDGRNAHLIQKPTSWWLPKFCRRFEIAHLKSLGTSFWIIVTHQSEAGGR